MKATKTQRGFNHIDLKCKYNMPFYIRQSSAEMSDVWLGIEGEKDAPSDGYAHNRIGDATYTILIDDRVWKEIKKARRLARK
jgi:hypothetical protein